MANKRNEGVIPAKYERFVVALLFAAIFASISWIAPMMYVTASQPADHVQINSVSVNETKNSTHNVTVDYHSRDKYPVEAQVTLFRQENGSSTAVEYWTTSAVLNAGSGTANLSLDLSGPPDPGQYYYAFNVDIHVGYNVQKTYVYETDTFSITNSTAKEAHQEPVTYPRG